MKSPFFVICVIFIILFGMSECKAEYIDLSVGGEIVDVGKCRHNDGKVYECVAVSHKEKAYFVLLDEKGEKAIYLIKDGKAVLLWTRDSI